MNASRAKKSSRRYEQLCPIAQTLDVIGDRWTLLILRDMLLGATKFSDFLLRSPRMPSRMLSDRLKKLEQHDIVHREVYSEHPLRAEYHLTETGETLRPVLLAIGAWGLDQFFTPRERKEWMQRLAKHGISVEEDAAPNAIVGANSAISASRPPGRASRPSRAGAR